jgi:hypothetical protein
MRFATAHLRDLFPVLTPGPDEIAEFDAGLRWVDRWPLRLVGLVGMCRALAMDSHWTANLGIESKPQPWGGWVAFFLSQDCLEYPGFFPHPSQASPL